MKFVITMLLTLRGELVHNIVEFVTANDLQHAINIVYSGVLNDMKRSNEESNALKVFVKDNCVISEDSESKAIRIISPLNVEF